MILRKRDGRTWIPYPGSLKTGSLEVAEQEIKLNGGKIVPLVDSEIRIYFDGGNLVQGLKDYD